MSSFTPFFDPSLPLFQSNFYPWLSFGSWNQNPFMLFSMKKKQLPEEKNLPPLFESKRNTFSTECSPLEEEYQPERQIEAFEVEERKSGGRVQCRGRNDYSNILKAFIHLIKTHPVLKEKIKQSIVKQCLNLSYERFLMRIRRKFSKGKTYISPKEILIFVKSCNQASDEGEKAIGLVFRIILKDFLSTEYVLCLIKSFKGKKQTRKDLITKTRQLFKLIFEEGCEEDQN